ncbi:MAG: plastocyanin/azurin family copper-binding protein [Candidatus Hodarchaeales archaeon]|jgi:uncharacterized cupredoxin-like copper-binding protein
MLLNVKSFGILIIGLLTLVALAGCLGSDQKANELTVTTSEFKFGLSKDTVNSGAVTLTVKNNGKIPHELMIYNPSDIDEILAMHTIGGEHMGDHMEMEDIVIFEIMEDRLPPGASETTTIKLQPGTYEVGCHLPGHYQGWMKSTLNVV